MSMVCVFLADGFEEIEALATVDILRRGKIDVKMVSISDVLDVRGSHNIVVKADCLFEEADIDSADMLFLPGGMPGTINLGNHSGLSEKIREFYDCGKKLAAICAAPSILGKMGLLENKKATCFPGFEDELKGAIYTGEKVVVDGNIVTGRGMGTAVDMGLELLKMFSDEKAAEEMAKTIQFI